MMIRGITLWLGMYGITSILFYIETGSVGKGLMLGLVSATLKTLWSICHSKVWGKLQVRKRQLVDETIPNCCCGL